MQGRSWARASRAMALVVAQKNSYTSCNFFYMAQQSFGSSGQQLSRTRPSVGLRPPYSLSPSHAFACDPDSRNAATSERRNPRDTGRWSLVCSAATAGGGRPGGQTLPLAAAPCGPCHLTPVAGARRGLPLAASSLFPVADDLAPCGRRPAGLATWPCGRWSFPCGR
jgi:hypothetical protein